LTTYRSPRNEQTRDGEDGIEVRLSISGVTYVALEGSKDCRGSVVKLSEFRNRRPT
jgi:hypothetical protein